MLLQRFKLTAEKFRELFSRNRKSPNGTWKDYYFEIRAYFEGWINELKIDSFDGLKNLMTADQMKKRCSPECKEHYLDIWEELISPEMLAEKLEAFDNIRRSLPSGPRRHVKASETVNDGTQMLWLWETRSDIKSRCPTCNLNASQRADVVTNHINAYTAQTKSPRLTLIDITLYGIKGRVCADTGSSHCYLLNIHQSLIPVYHPLDNPVERKNRDLKPRLAILVQDKHDCWSEKLPFIRFALSTAKCETTGQTAAFLNFGRELRTPSKVVNDIRIREVVEEQQDSRKFYADKKRKAAPTYQPGEHVFVASHPLSNAAQGRSAKLMPRRDVPYVILTQRSPSSYEIASLDNLGEPLGVYHTSALTPCNNDRVKPVIPLRKRGRPPRVPQTPGSSSGRRRNQRGRM
ncbi:integrase catalytic domain-containing protein [Trichonephila clavipes]|nr:integrase catalytic domain-containing protein [Trichonephila clavipes]